MENKRPAHAENQTIRVLIADDFVPFRQNLITTLAGSQNFELVGQASNGREAVEQARTLRPHVIVMDFRMPEMDGAAAATRIQEKHPAIVILMTSLSFERQYVSRALLAGVRGYLAKDDAHACLVTAINTVLSGQGYLSPKVADLVRQTAPPSPLAVTQQVLWTFDREAPALLACARSIAHPSAADAAVNASFQAYWMALRETQSIADPQTWLLLSIAAHLFPSGAAPPKPWSFTRAHLQDWDLTKRASADARLLEHVSACRPCHLAWTLAAHNPQLTCDPEALRSSLIRHLEAPDEPELFLSAARRQARVMRLVASELELLLGSTAGKGWTRREASAGSWLAGLLGGKSAVRANEAGA